MSVSTAASELGVSRKTYYQWEAKAFDSMIAILQDKEPGRPALPVESEKERQIRERLEFLEKQNAEFMKREDLIRAACKLKIDLMKGRAEKKSAY
jgi:transposase